QAPEPQDEDAAPQGKGDGKLIEDEERFTGSIGWSVFKAYLLSAGGPGFLASLVALCLATQLVDSLIKGLLALQSRDGAESLSPVNFLAVFLSKCSTPFSIFVSDTNSKVWVCCILRCYSCDCFRGSTAPTTRQRRFTREC